MRIYFATTNLKKLKELREIVGVELVQMSRDVVEIQGTMEEIVGHKLSQVAPLIGEDEAVIVDDTGISLEALGGFPGVYAKDFICVGGSKINEIVKRMGDDRVTAFCGLGIAHYKDGVLVRKVFSGECRGRIVGAGDEHLADFNHIFVPDGFDRCFGEMSVREKNMVSHRGVAGGKLVEYMGSVGMIKDLS